MSSGFSESPSPGASAWKRAVSTIIQWRNWRLAVKIAAVVLVPLVFALTLGIFQVRDQIEKAAEYERLDAVVTAAGSVRETVTLLQQERIRSAEFLERGEVSDLGMQQRFAETDGTVSETKVVLRNNAEITPVIGAARERVDGQLGSLPQLREQVLHRELDPGSAIDSYTTVIDTLLALDRTLINEVSYTQLGSTPATLHELATVGEEMHLQQAWVLVGLLRGEFTPENIVELRASETRRLSSAKDFRAVAHRDQRQAYDQLHANPSFPARERSLRMAMASTSPAGTLTTPVPESMVSPQEWESQSHTVIRSLQQLQDGVDEKLHQTTFTLEENASNMAGLGTVLLLSAALAAAGAAAVFARQLLNSLETLRHSALDTARRHLPRNVAEILAGTNPARAGRVPLNTTEELGQVARAFDDVQEQAITLAAEQSELRKSYSDSFINVSRRSQSLLERQLRLFERLERDEEDPDQLSTLFQLDHLATRMRRNNENLMVLSGSDLVRRFTQPTAPADLVRAAISEIEHYPRVVVQPLPEVKVVGYACSDVVRLLAELFDNAANFSAPETTVAVSGHRRGDGSTGIDIVDRGIGMSNAEIDAVNERLANGGAIKESTSRRMGLFVVRRLANRHGISVQLRPGAHDVGIQVTVSLQADLLVDGAGQPSPATALRGLGNGQKAPRELEDTLVDKLDWTAYVPETNGSAPGVRNGFHLLNPSNGTSTPHSAPSPEPEEPAEEERPLFAAYRQPSESEQDGVGGNGGSERTSPTNGVSSGTAHHNGAPTPIFDRLASAWFDASATNSTPDHDETAEVQWPPPAPDEYDDDLPDSDAASTRAETNSTPPDSEGNSEEIGTAHAATTGEGNSPNYSNGTPRWNFTADNARRRAEEVTSAQPAGYTDVGLPVRVPKAHLLAGSAGTEPPTTDSGSARDPELTRTRLSQFQRGVRRVRGNTESQPERGDPATKAPESGTTEGAEMALSHGENNNGSSLSGQADYWSPRQDTLAAEATAAMQHEPADYTSAGLPRRTPRTHVTPDLPTEAPVDPPQARDADVMRGRLSSFQRGVRQGKHCLRDPAEDPNGQQ